MATTPPHPAGFVSSLRSLGDGLLASIQDRLELVSIELQEEKYRLIQTFFWLSALVFLGMMAVVFGSLTLVYLFWDSARLAVLGGLTALYFVALVVMIVGFRRHLARQPDPFASTQQELSEDRSCFRNKN
jgi:uncharacterized membrane protein YqjE